MPEKSLIDELEEAIQSGSKEKRVDTLRRMTDLFVADADRLNDRQIDVFDQIIGHLISKIEGRALAELSKRLAPIDNSPIEVIRRLSRDDDIAVAQPVLVQSRRLTEKDLIEIANTKAQGHLLAISSRAQIGINVTDALLRRGDQQVLQTLAENIGASFSETGFATLVKRSEDDVFLAEKVGSRLDIPLRLFRELLQKATEAVRSRLLEVAGPENREKIRWILKAITDDAEREAGFGPDTDYAEACGRMLAAQQKGQLSGETIAELAKNNRAVDLVAAISVLCGAPAELIVELLQSKHREAVLVPCKAAGLDWQTVRTILASGALKQLVSDQFLDDAKTDYVKLTRNSAARVLRFWQVRHSASTNSDGTESSAKVAV